MAEPTVPDEALLIDLPPRLLTPRLVLRPPHAGDGPQVHAAVMETLDELAPWMPWVHPEPEAASTEAQVRRAHAAALGRSDFTFYAFERGRDDAEGAFVAAGGLHRLDWSVRRFEIGYWRRSAVRGAGLVDEMVRALTRLAFDTLGARRVEIRMDTRNLRSARVAERCGYTFEGVLRQDALDTAGAWRDTRVCARVRGVEEPDPACGAQATPGDAGAGADGLAGP